MKLPASRIGWRVKKGCAQKVRIEYNKRGTSTVTPISDWQPVTKSLIDMWKSGKSLTKA